MSRKTAAAPGTKVRTFSLDAPFVSDKSRVVSEKATVKFGRPLSVCIASQHITEQLIISSELPGLIIWVRLVEIDKDVTALPELPPPGLMFIPRGFFRPVSVIDQSVQTLFPLLDCFGLGRMQVYSQPVRFFGRLTTQFPGLEVRMCVATGGRTRRNHPLAFHQAAECPVLQRIPHLVLDFFKFLLLYFLIKKKVIIVVAMIPEDSIVLVLDVVRIHRDLSGVSDQTHTGKARLSVVSRQFARSVAPVLILGRDRYRGSAFDINVNHGPKHLNPDSDDRADLRTLAGNFDVALS